MTNIEHFFAQLAIFSRSFDDYLHCTFLSSPFPLSVIEEGDDIRGIITEKTLVLANHQSTGDVPMLMATFNSKPNVLPNIMWIMDKIFKYTNFGVVSVLHQDFFILSVMQTKLFLVICQKFKFTKMFFSFF